MSTIKRRMGVALLCAPIALFAGGCACFCKSKTTTVRAAPAPQVKTVAELLPPYAKPGECYVKVFVPEEFETMTEQVCVREASARLEIVPARYEWVEERVVVKEASTVLEEVPAEFAWEERTIQVEPGHKGWHAEKTCARLVSDPLVQEGDQMFCLAEHPPKYETIRTQVIAKPATTRAITIPAEYQTVRRQKLVAPATTRSVPIPAEFATVTKTRRVRDSHVEWRRVDCTLEGLPQDTTVIHEPLTMSDY